MNVVILAGGFGTRLSEETEIKPKPMLEIGEKPILWHLMKYFSYYGFNEFIICCGYKGYIIKEYFANYFLHQSDVTIDLENNSTEVHHSNLEPWKITLVDTGLSTMTGGRLLQVKKYIKGETFFLTYGDGLSDVNLNELIAFHKQQGKHATVTAVQPPGRFGSLDVTSIGSVKRFIEKPHGDGGWINGGFFVLNSEIFNYIKQGDKTVWEKKPLEDLASARQLSAFKHHGFWKPMDTLRDKKELENLWNSGNPSWKVWKE